MKMNNRPVTLILLALTVFRIFICKLQYVKYLTFLKEICIEYNHCPS